MASLKHGWHHRFNPKCPLPRWRWQYPATRQIIGSFPRLRIADRGGGGYYSAFHVRTKGAGRGLGRQSKGIFIKSEKCKEGEERQAEGWGSKGRRMVKRSNLQRWSSLGCSGTNTVIERLDRIHQNSTIHAVKKRLAYCKGEVLFLK